MKEKEACDRIVAKRKNEINTLNNKTEYDKLLYHFKSEDGIRIRLKNVNCPNRQKFGSNLSEIKREK